ncbi:hypothetical protein SAMN05421755_10519 [Nitrosomonas sp. Nm33]|nr:hypothetical protein SAMN05421755_10519 [Nitrosomonas sp. Nm33]
MLFGTGSTIGAVAPSQPPPSPLPRQQHSVGLRPCLVERDAPGLAGQRAPPGRQPALPALLPQPQVQARQGHRVAQQGQAGLAVELFRPVGQRLLHAFAAQRLGKPCRAVPRRAHGAGQGVEQRIDRRPDETVPECSLPVLPSVLIGGTQLLRRVVLFGDEEQFTVARTQTQPDPAGDHRHRDG